MIRHTYSITRFLHRRHQNVLKEAKLIPNVMTEIIQKSVIEKPKDWENVRMQILTSSGPRSQISANTIDAMTIGVCTSLKKYDLAFSYLDYLKSKQIKLNLATIGKVFKLFYEKNKDVNLAQKDKEEIISFYDSVRKSFPILDSITLENMIQALSITKRGELCKELLEEMKKTVLPNSASYSATISVHFRNNQNDLAWQLLLEMLENKRQPHGFIFPIYLNKVKEVNNPIEKTALLEKLLQFLQDTNLVLDAEGARAFSQKETQISNRGICLCCKSKLKTFDLTTVEFNDLKQKIMSNVIIGKDIFHKTTPDEIDKFRQFIAEGHNFDVVIDGLNVAYSVGVKQSPLFTSALVAAVVSHFVKQDKKVLVLGRSHMNKWPKRNWGYVTNNATVFLTQNLSHDDPYLLYCALNSGKDTIIVTRDLMRSHKFLLKNFQEKFLFDRWLLQRQHQLIRVKENGEPIFKYPVLYSEVAQKVGSHWHIPFIEGNRTRTSSLSWICYKID